MSAMASQITDVSIICSVVCSGADRRKHESSASMAFVRGMYLCPVDSHHKGTVTRKMFKLMTSSWKGQQRKMYHEDKTDVIHCRLCRKAHKLGMLFHRIIKAQAKQNNTLVMLLVARDTIATQMCPCISRAIRIQDLCTSCYVAFVVNHGAVRYLSWLMYTIIVIPDDVIKWRHFPRYWSFVRRIHRSPVNSPHKGQWRREQQVSKQSRRWWFETPWCPLCRHSNVDILMVPSGECDRWWRFIFVDTTDYFDERKTRHYMKTPIRREAITWTNRWVSARRT